MSGRPGRDMARRFTIAARGAGASIRSGMNKPDNFAILSEQGRDGSSPFFRTTFIINHLQQREAAQNATFVVLSSALLSTRRAQTFASALRDAVGLPRRIIALCFAVAVLGHLRVRRLIP
jgi:hypothetical protein